MTEQIDWRDNLPRSGRVDDSGAVMTGHDVTIRRVNHSDPGMAPSYRVRCLTCGGVEDFATFAEALAEHDAHEEATAQ